MEQPPHDLDDLLRCCTVRVEHSGGRGTGFFVGPGLVLTYAHMVEDAQPKALPVEVHWNNQQYPAQIAAFFPKPYPDTALLHIDMQQHPCVYLHADIDLRDALYSYGYTDDFPSGDSATFEYEGPAGQERPLLKMKIGQARPGLSGAPLLNLWTGGVCGMVKSTRDRSSDLGGLAIPITVILTLVKDLETEQQRFHQQDEHWIDSLGLQQRQRFPWQIAGKHNPFYGESSQMLGRDEERRRIEEKLRAGNHCSIVGPPGSGKSLLLKEISKDIASWLHCQPHEVVLVRFRGITSLRELQEHIVSHLGGQREKDWRNLLRVKPLRLLLLDDLGGMDPGRRGLDMHRWLRGLDDLFRTKLLMVSNERLDVLFRKDDPTRDSPLAGLDPSPVQLAPLPARICAQIVQQRLAGTSISAGQFADLCNEPRQPRELLDLCAAHYDELRQGKA